MAYNAALNACGEARTPHTRHESGPFDPAGFQVFATCVYSSSIALFHNSIEMAEVD